MFKYFSTSLQTVIKDEEIIENAIVVSCLATVQTDGNIEIPSEYYGCDILGTMYEPTEKKFYQVEPYIVTEQSQLDRIESQLLDIQAYQVEQAYEAAMAAIEGA